MMRIADSFLLFEKETIFGKAWRTFCGGDKERAILYPFVSPERQEGGWAIEGVKGRELARRGKRERERERERRRRRREVTICFRLDRAVQTNRERGCLKRERERERERDGCKDRIGKKEREKAEETRERTEIKTELFSYSPCHPVC